MIQDSIKAREENGTDSDGGEGITTKNDEGEKKVVCEVESVPLNYKQAIGNMMVSILSCKYQLVNVSGKAVHFWTKASSSGDVLSHANYEGHSKVPTGRPW